MVQTPPPALAAGIERFVFPAEAEPVLAGMMLTFAPATLTAVLGGSGSGKSTLGRLLAGWLLPGGGGTLTGFLELAGTRVRFTGTAADPRIDPGSWGRQVGFVPQDPAAALSTVRATVAEELAFGLENAGVDRESMASAVRHTAALTGLAHLLDRDPATLSGGQLRRLAIGCAVIQRPAVLVMDEPFASLDTDGAEVLAALVRNLVQDGTAVVILSQRADAFLHNADTWLVLAGGTVAASGTPAEVVADGALEMAGVVRPRPVKGLRTPAEKGQPSAVGSPPALELRDVSFTYRLTQCRGWFKAQPGPPADPVLHGLSLTVRPGEILAVAGSNGAGKSTLLRHLNGLLQPTAGSVLVNGRNISGDPAGRVAHDVGLLFQQPRDQLFERTVEREVRFGLERHGPAADQTVQHALAAVGLEHLAGRHPAELPASQQRLLALATVLARRPSVLALDEPTIALDGHGLARLDEVVRSTTAEGTAVVLVTHDLDYARSIAHRLVRLDDGRLLPAD
ncbi:ATP-binding cassette domain-containing protein [Pseudarthrobacter psychrotolerans]|uniref:ATP-binding cassette domain-containing protein n=1 Tax=Pseudarthrobacter psychrotolerans TaxID=2697569 RepID=A0A6P1NJ93_9MICC|nr:ABC transporter ATP-binding protein [Pseudarthrobacter psychrotolerans]QHK18867.1 ATP-binding cassette domain-containing protein [Pseudarthrobacter psychrotolerans]